MSELNINELIKIIIGAIVVVAVIIGAYFIFKDKILGVFSGISVDDHLPKFFRSLLL